MHLKSLPFVTSSSWYIVIPCLFLKVHVVREQIDYCRGWLLTLRCCGDFNAYDVLLKVGLHV